MRLIDADALKKDIVAYKTMPEIRKAICDVIDNAPTVDIVSPTINVNIPEKTKQELIEELQKPHKLFVLPEPENVEYPFYQEAYQTGYEEGRKNFERPKGKWIYKEFDAESGISRSYWCSNCGEPKSQWCNDFCQRCGADMRGEKNDN